MNKDAYSHNFSWKSNLYERVYTKVRVFHHDFFYHEGGKGKTEQENVKKNTKHLLMVLTKPFFTYLCFIHVVAKEFAIMGKLMKIGSFAGALLDKWRSGNTWNLRNCRFCQRKFFGDKKKSFTISFFIIKILFLLKLLNN